MTERPAGVPPEAWWLEKDQEWSLGDKDAQGRLQGVIRFWRPDGTLVNECDHVDGTPHGKAIRFHESGEVSQTACFERGTLVGTRTFFATDTRTTEGMHANGVAKTVRRMELDYVAGTVVAFRYFDGAGRPTGRDGVPLPARPDGVPVEAQFDGKGEWVAGQWTETSEKRGALRRWNAAGVLVNIEDHGNGGGVVVSHTFRTDDGSPRVRFTFTAPGVRLAGPAEAWRRDGTPIVRAHFAGDGEETVLEQLAPDGTVARHVTYRREPSRAREEHVPLADADTLVLDALEEHDASVVEAALPLSATGLAHAIAIGWGGSDDRDSTQARLARRLVKARAPASLQVRLATFGMDRAPRLITPARVLAVAQELAQDPAVDGEALTAMLIEGGGTGLALALATPARAEQFIRDRIRDGFVGLQHLGLAELPPALGRFPGVMRIDASGNRLTTVPPELSDIFRLMSLDLSTNRIATLPPELAWLPDLRTLYLAKNQLTQVPPIVWELGELQSLSLGDNELAELPDAIAGARALQSLWLHDNPLRDLPRAMATLPALKFLHLGDHPWAEPPAVIAEITSLEELWIASPNLERLPVEVVTLPRLRRLMCWYSGLTAVPRELFEAKGLQELRIKHNPLPDGTIEALQEALPNCTIY